MAFKIDMLTGAQYDEVELIIGTPIGPEVPFAKIARAVGYVRTKAAKPGLTHADYNERTVAQQIADSGLVAEDDEAGKAPTS